MVFWMQNTQSSSFRKETHKTSTTYKMLASKQVARKRRFLARKNLSECWPGHVNEMNAAIRRIISPETFWFSLFLHRHLQKTQTRHFWVCFELIFASCCSRFASIVESKTIWMQHFNLILFKTHCGTNKNVINTIGIRSISFIQFVVMRFWIRIYSISLSFSAKSWEKDRNYGRIRA